MKNGKRTFILTEIVLGLLVATLAFFMLYNKNEQKAERIAVVIPDIEESQWSAFKYGLKMASQEYGVNTVLISKANINMSEDEIEVVQQEIDKGADAIIVKMVGGSKEYSKLKKIQKKVPIMLAGESPDNNVEKKSAIPVTEPDQYDMGVALAGKLLENNNGNLRGKKIGIYTESSCSGADSKREKGVRDTLKDSGAKILWSVSRDEGIKKKVILQSQRKVDIVLALDDTSLVEAGEAAKQNNLSGAIVYGIGNSTLYIILIQGGQRVLLYLMNLRQVINVLLKQSRSYVHHFIRWKIRKYRILYLPDRTFSRRKIKICYLRSVNKMRQASLLRQISSPNMI